MLIETSILTHGIYVHIPHCLQKCHYCDFPTVLLKNGPDLDEYCDQIVSELGLQLLPRQQGLSSVYFGGGTPSLLGPRRVARLLKAINDNGYKLNPNCEITYEINPGTLTENDLKDLKSIGVNRFSLGVQTFDDPILKLIGREHKAIDSHQTLNLLKGSCFSADLILGLPSMTFDKFKNDVEQILLYSPDHISIYLLTVPELHFLNQQMPQNDDLEDLLNQAEPYLKTLDFYRYEISNYVHKQRRPSQHNLLHWNDLSYWGVGLGAHSYFKDLGHWGTRFWNPRSLKSYQSQLQKRLKTGALPPAEQVEPLQLHESMTDFCFTHLRQASGIPKDRCSKKFPDFSEKLITDRLFKLTKQGYIFESTTSWRLTDHGKKFADFVFRELCFNKKELEGIHNGNK